MVQKRVIDILVKIFFEIALPSRIFSAHQFKSFAMIDLVQLLHVLHTMFQRTDQANVKNVVEFAGDDVRAPPNQDNLAQLSEVKNRISYLVNQYRGRRV